MKVGDGHHIRKESFNPLKCGVRFSWHITDLYILTVEVGKSNLNKMWVELLGRIKLFRTWVGIFIHKIHI